METKLEHGSTAWKDKRWSSVTGTEVASVLGLNPECSRGKLLRLKAQRAEETPSDYGKRLMYLGTEFEPVARAAYLRWSGDRGRIPNLFIDNTHPWLTGTPDWVSEQERTVAEFKTHFHPTPLTSRPIESTQKMPFKYYLQVQTYLHILADKRGILFSWTPCHGFTVFEITPDPELMRLIIPELEKFMASLRRVKTHGTESVEGLSEVSKNKVSKVTKDFWIQKIWESLQYHTKQVVNP